MHHIETTVTYLEMRSEPHQQYALPANLKKLLLVRAENPALRFYRYLYDAVGHDYVWVDRKKLDDAALAAIIHDERVEVWPLYVAGQPAGYFEIDARAHPVAELEYFGLIPEFQGMGLGKWFLAEAIRACWARKPERVTVQTCTLDGPAALPLYQKLGFVPYDRRDKVMELPD
jgi:GNAT superfamily N-acetyltransferase